MWLVGVVCAGGVFGSGCGAAVPVPGGLHVDVDGGRGSLRGSGPSVCGTPPPLHPDLHCCQLR